MLAKFSTEKPAKRMVYLLDQSTMLLRKTFWNGEYNQDIIEAAGQMIVGEKNGIPVIAEIMSETEKKTYASFLSKSK